MVDKLTSKTYWETYYKKNHAKKEHIEIVCSYYDSIWELYVKKQDKKQSLLEIGGFPGRYLAYLAKKYELEPTSLDYNSDSSQIKDAFKAMDVNTYHIIQEDFTQYHPNKTYDYVMSNGFIEHFENYSQILDLHVNYLAENGRLLVMIPNMRGYIRFYKYLVDYKNLKVHNLKCMKLKIFRDFAKRHHLSILHLDYFGGFPFSVHQKHHFLQRQIYRMHRLFFKFIANPWVERHPNKYLSSAIIAIFEKR